MNEHLTDLVNRLAAQITEQEGRDRKRTSEAQAHFWLSLAHDRNAPSASKKLVEAYLRTGLPCVGLAAVNDPENYGVVSMNGELVKEIIEKPVRENAPSNLVLCGRYVFTPDTSKLLSEYDYGQYGELQSIAIQQHWMQNEGLVGVELKGFQWYDSGAPLPWLKGQIDYALRRGDMSDELRSWLNDRLQR